MDIVLCTDDNYVAPTRVLICSICENNKGENLCFHIISESLSEKNRLYLRDDCEKYNSVFRLYLLDEFLLNNMPVGKAGQPTHVTLAAYNRLFVSSILPENIDKVLYMDCDVIVRHSLASLWRTDISNVAVACVTDNDEGDVKKFNRLRYPQCLGYFNSGVLLINLDYWRKNDIQSQFLSFIMDYPERLLLHDQDVLNYVLREKKIGLPLTYNVQDGFLLSLINCVYYDREEELDEALRNPVIIHFSSSNKPWKKTCTNPWKDEWIKYRIISGLRKEDFPEWNDRLPIKIIIRKVFEKMGIVHGGLKFRDDITRLSSEQSTRS